MTTKDEAGDYATGDESSYQYDNDASYYGQQVSYRKPDQSAVGGNGTTAIEQSSTETDHSGLENQSFEIDAATQEIVDELKAELSKLDSATNKHAVRLLKAEIERLTTFSEPDYLEVDIPKPIRIVRKVMVPINRNPKFNFVGKLLGPGGKTLQNLIHTTRCRIYILGRGSSREKAKEEELLTSGDPKFAHLKDPLYVRVEASGPAAIAYQKIAHVLNELQYYLQPVKDDIYMQQMADMGKHVIPPPSGPPMRGGHRGALMGPGPPRGAMIPRGGPRGGGAPRGRGFLIQTPPGSGPTQSGPPPSSAPPPSGPPPNYVTYPGYDYGSCGDYQQSAPPQAAAPHYGNAQPPPPSGPPPIPPPVGVPPGPPSGPPPPAPPSSAYGASSTYSYPYGYDYSQYNQSSVGTPGPPPRPPGPPTGGGKAPPPMGRGRGMPRPSPY